MTDVFAVLNAIPLLGLMLVIALGYSLGRVSLWEVSLGPAGATLFVALALGHLGLAAGTGAGSGASLGTLGLALFIYGVGFDAAPHFFSCFRESRGWRFLVVAFVVNAMAVVATVVCSRVLELDASTAAGLLAGALTSAPTYAAASEVAPDPTRLSVAFAITYPFGLVGVVLLIQLLPRLMGEDLSRGTASEDEVYATGLRRGGSTSLKGGPEMSRTFEAREPEVLGRPLRELDLIRKTGCVILRLHCGNEVVIPDGEAVLERGDHVLARGRVDELREFERCLGPEVFHRETHERALPTRRVQVRSPEVVGRTLAELGIIHRHHCVITGIERGSLSIEPDPQVSLVRDDVVEVMGRSDDIRAAARQLGRFEPSLRETDIAVYAGGIVLGLLIGAVSFEAFGAHLGLGSAGGLLLVGLALGWQQRLGPFRTYVPLEARQLMRDLGILLFVGETGLVAGGRMVEGLQTAPWQIFAAGAAVNLLVVGGALVVARRVLALRPLDAWGSVSGGLTSSAALHAVRRVADSNEAAISYATAYAVGSVLATLAGPLVVLLLR